MAPDQRQQEGLQKRAWRISERPAPNPIASIAASDYPDPMSAPSSSTFWSLIDRLHVPDDQALELVAYDGKLPTTGRRPRFKLSPEQERIVSTLVQMDNALATVGLDAGWLNRDDGSTGRTPLDLMRAGAMDEVLHSLTQAALRASLQPTPRPRRKR
jgi:hypothetical protein